MDHCAEVTYEVAIDYIRIGTQWLVHTTRIDHNKVNARKPSTTGISSMLQKSRPSHKYYILLNEGQLVIRTAANAQLRPLHHMRLMRFVRVGMTVPDLDFETGCTSHAPPHTIADLDRELPPLQPLVNKPQAHHKLLSS